MAPLGRIALLFVLLTIGTWAKQEGDGMYKASPGSLTQVTFSGGCGKALCPPEETQLPIPGYFCDCKDFITDPHPECHCPGHEPPPPHTGDYCNPNVAGVRPGNCAEVHTESQEKAQHEQKTCSHDESGCVSFDAAPTCPDGQCHTEAQVAPCACSEPAPAPCTCGAQKPTLPRALKHLSIDFPASKTIMPATPKPTPQAHALLDDAQQEIKELESVSLPEKKEEKKVERVSCVVSEWGAWSPCSAECGPGNSSRTREVKQAPKHGGQECPHLQETKTCETQPCPQDCQVDEWAPWSECSKTCGEGRKVRTRRVVRGAAWGGKACPPVEEDSKCKIRECADDCVMTNWTAYSKCDKTCGGGYRVRTRKILKDAANGGAPCGETIDKEKCNVQSCPVNCEVGPFSNWSICSVTCGGGVSTRKREIITEANFGGKECPSLSEQRMCGNHSCMQDCVVSSWGVFGPCSKSCGSGVKVRERLIKRQPTDGGADCPALREEQACNAFPCPRENVTQCRDIKDELFNELEGAGRAMLRESPVAVFKQSAEVSVSTEEQLQQAVTTRNVWVYFSGESIKLTKDLVLDRPGIVLDGRDRAVRIFPDPSVKPLPKVVITKGAVNVVIVGISFEGFSEVSSGSWDDSCGGASAEKCEKEADHTALQIDQGVTSVWIHRCRFSGAGKGIVFAESSGHAQENTKTAVSLRATVSWSYFGNMFDSLSLGQPGQLTVHHNFFDSDNRRSPKCGHAEGKLHAYNNVIAKYGKFGAMSISGCQLLIEQDRFDPADKSGEAVSCISQGVALVRETTLPTATATRCQTGNSFSFEPCKSYDYIAEFSEGNTCAIPNGCARDVKKCTQNNEWAKTVQSKTKSTEKRTCTLAQDGIQTYSNLKAQAMEAKKEATAEKGQTEHKQETTAHTNEKAETTETQKKSTEENDKQQQEKDKEHA